MADDQNAGSDGGLDREERLRTILFRAEQEARQWQDSELTRHREDSLDYYDRNLNAFPAEDGQSKIITSEFADTIESIMPALLRVFTGGESIVDFTPDNPGDEDAAKEATDYIPHVLMRENEGFTWFTWFLKDALMYRLSWGAVDVEEVEQVKSKPFGPIPADAFALLSQQATQMAEQAGAELTIDAEQDQPEQPKASKASVDYSPGHPDSHCAICSNFQGGACAVTSSDGPPTPGRIDPNYWCKQFQAGQPQPAPAVTFSGTITTKRKVKKVRVDNIAPEDGLVSPTARHIDEAGFVGYRKRVTASQLRTMGLDQETIDNLSSDDIYTVEESQRQPGVVQAASARDQRDDSERELWVVVAFVRFDWDGDGISEMLRVVYAHAGGSVSAIIEREEWEDGVAPIVTGSPILMSHTIPGRSIFDLVKDLQQVGTAVTRGMLDNTYMVNRPRPIASDVVDLASLIDWTPGMPIRPRQGQKMIRGQDIDFLQVPPVMDKSLAVLQWQDEVKHKRTGIQPGNQGVLDESMNPTATGANLATAAADARLELIARTFAEVPIKRLFRLIYRAVKRAASGPVKYWNGSDFATVDPTKWPDDMSLEVSVGMGVSNKQQQLQYLGLVGQGQEKLWEAQGGQEGPMLTVDHLANTFRKAVEVAGFKNTGQFVNSDQQIMQAKAQKAQQPPPPNPEMMKVQAQSQARMAEVQANAQAKAAEQQNDAQLAQQKLAADIQSNQARAAADMQIAREKAALDMQLKREQAALDAQLKREELVLEAQLKREQMKMDADTANDTNIQEQQVTDE
jgi:hypothetical protein